LSWEVEFHKDFDPEFEALPEDVQTDYALMHYCWSSLARNSAGLRRYA
jgi:hypothetical protein